MEQQTAAVNLMTLMTMYAVGDRNFIVDEFYASVAAVCFTYLASRTVSRFSENLPEKLYEFGLSFATNSGMVTIYPLSVSVTENSITLSSN